MRTMRFFTLLAGIIAAMFLFSSSSSARKMATIVDEYQKNGMSIIGYGNTIIYFHDGRNIYWKDIKSGKAEVLVKTNKIYLPTEYYSLLQPEEELPGYDELDTRYLDGNVTIFENFDGYTIRMIGENHGVILDGKDERNYIFLKSDPSRPIVCGDDYSMPETSCEEVSSIPFYIPLYGNLWDYGKESRAFDELPKIPSYYVSKDVLEEWGDPVSVEVAKDPLAYHTKVELLADGTLNKNNYGRFYFDNIGKSYCADEIVDGSMFFDVMDALQDSVKAIRKRKQQVRRTEILKSFRSRAVEIEEIGNMYQNNPMVAQQTYPVGHTYNIFVTLDNIKTTNYSDYPYVIQGSGCSYPWITYYFYSNDESFVNLTYRKHACVRAKLFKIDHDSDMNVEPIFISTELLMW